MSSPRTGILSLIRFELGQNLDVFKEVKEEVPTEELGCERLTNQNFWLDGSRASFLVPGYSTSKSLV